MNQLFVYAHPNKNSFCHAMLDRMIEVVSCVGDLYKVSDLYAMRFNPVLSAEDLEAMQHKVVAPDVLHEQEKILWADVITFLYPIWWSGMPAILKGYIDRVFTSGFAYIQKSDTVETLLLHKKFLMLCTTGQSETTLRSTGIEEAIYKTVDMGIFGFCGLMLTEYRFFYAVPTVMKNERKEMLEKVASIILKYSSPSKSVPYFD